MKRSLTTTAFQVPKKCFGKINSNSNSISSSINITSSISGSSSSNSSSNNNNNNKNNTTNIKNKMEISQIGLGCSSFGNVYGTMSDKDCYELVKTSLDYGINYFDTSPFYGNNKSEQRLGNIFQSLQRNYPNDKIYNRTNYYISTKLGRYDNNVFDFSVKRVQDSLKKSLEYLQVDYIDTVFVHDIEFAHNLDQIWNETLPYLYELKNNFNNNNNNNNIKIKYIGLSGMPLNVLDYVLNKFGYDKVDMILTYNTNVLFNQELIHYLPRLQKHNIGIIHGGVTGLGLLTPKGPPSWHPANHLPIFKSLCKEAQQTVQSLYQQQKKNNNNNNDNDNNNNNNNQMDDLELVRLAYFYCFQNNAIHSTLAGATSLQELHKYLEWTQQNQSATASQIKKDQDTIRHLQHTVLAPIMNRMWINPGTEKNISDAYLKFYS